MLCQQGLLAAWRFLCLCENIGLRRWLLNLSPLYRHFKSTDGCFECIPTAFDLLFLTGATIKNIHATRRRKSFPCQQQDGIDTTLLSMELAGGVFASVHCCRQSGRGYDQRVEIAGCYFCKTATTSPFSSPMTRQNQSQPCPTLAPDTKTPPNSSCAHFIAACQNNDSQKRESNNRW